MHYVFSPVGGDVFPYRGTYLPLQGKIEFDSISDNDILTFGFIKDIKWISYNHIDKMNRASIHNAIKLYDEFIKHIGV